MEAKNRVATGNQLTGGRLVVLQMETPFFKF